MNIIANLLSNTATNVAENGSSACIGFVWEEAVCPEEIL